MDRNRKAVATLRKAITALPGFGYVLVSPIVNDETWKGGQVVPTGSVRLSPIHFNESCTFLHRYHPKPLIVQVALACIDDHPFLQNLGFCGHCIKAERILEALEQNQQFAGHSLMTI